MIIYRIVGRAEAFRHCGMLTVDPMADTSATRLRKRGKWLAEEQDAAGLKYKFRMLKTVIKPITQVDVVKLFATEDLHNLIESSEEITSWSNQSE